MSYLLKLNTFIQTWNIWIISIKYHYEKKVSTMTVNKSTIINTRNNNLSPQSIDHSSNVVTLKTLRCWKVLFTDENGPDLFINLFFIFMCFICWIIDVYLLLFFLLNLHWTIFVSYRVLYLQSVSDTIVLSNIE